MPKDSYKLLLEDAKKLNKEIAELNKRVKKYHIKMKKKTDEFKMDKIRKKIGLK
ncbi:MAG: hypothetical protein NTW66_02965 [Candidatus Magasanikbacteria bacterium]|nr:hypothetical protein [Candidatus Magasanikbacteria bacterium]